MSTENTKEIVPPYLSVARMERILELAQTRNLNPVNSSLFVNYGFSQSDAGLAVNFLRFLGAVDEGGKPTPAMNALRLESEDRRKEALQPIIKAAYVRLFDNVKDPYALSRADLADEFKVRYDLSSRVIEGALPVFLRLSEHAGLAEPGTVTRRTTKVRGEGKTSSFKTPSKLGKQKMGEDAAVSGLHTQQIVKGKMTITIPEDVFIKAGIDDELNEAWRSVLKSAHTFAAKYLEGTKEVAPATESSP